MLKELEQNAFKRVLPLVQGLDYWLALRAAVEGNNPGRIFVDDVDNPSTFFALTVEGYLLAGDYHNEKTNNDICSFLAEQIFTGQIYVRNKKTMFLTVFPEVWEGLLPELIPTHHLLKRERYHYVCRAVTVDWRSSIPEGYTVHRVDYTVLNDTRIVFPDILRSWMDIDEQWGTKENFVKKGVSFCVLYGQNVVSWCTPDCVAGDHIDVGVITHPDHRQRGLAAVAVAATVDYCLNHGFSAVGWHCNATNTASKKTAEKVGFNREHAYTEYFYRYDLVQHLGELAWHYFQLTDYEKSVSYFEQLFAQSKDHPNDTYHIAAEAWAFLENKEKTLTYLRAAAEHGWKYPEYTKKVKEFFVLHDTAEWKTIVARMEKNAKR